MRFFLVLLFALGCLFGQSSCGMLMHQANSVKQVLQWPFRAELDPRFLDGVEDLDRDHDLPAVS